MSTHQCSLDGARRGFRCCKAFKLLADDCDRCEGEGCAQCRHLAKWSEGGEYSRPLHRRRFVVTPEL